MFSNSDRRDIGSEAEIDLLRLTFQNLNTNNQESRDGDKEMSEKERRSNENTRRNNINDNYQHELRVFCLDEISWHDTEDDCWLVIRDYVYDCTEFLKKHPGGADVLLEYAGRDATLAFIGTGHSKYAQKILDKYIIGELPDEERIFRRPGGIRIV